MANDGEQAASPTSDAPEKPTKRRPTAADGDMTAEELVAHHLRAQTRLRGVVEEVVYTDEAQGLGSGTIRCLELEQSVPFSCRNISLEKGVLRIAHAGDPCTMKLSCRGQEVRATSIRIKARRPAPEPADEPAAENVSPRAPKSSKDPVVAESQRSTSQHEPVGPSPQQGRSPVTSKAEFPSGGDGNSGPHDIFKRDSPLNALEYNPPPADAGNTPANGNGTGASGQGSSFGLSPHPAGPPQWPGSMPWSAMEPITPGQSLNQQQQQGSMPMPPQLPQSLRQTPPPAAAR